MDEAPREVLNRVWRKLVIKPGGALGRRFYTFCVLGVPLARRRPFGQIQPRPA